MNSEAASILNGSFTTNFDLDESNVPQFGTHNDGRVNRTLITRDEVRDTSFSAALNRVHYGTYKGEPACLVSIDFSFRFRLRVLSRYSHASIKVTFKRAMDIHNHKIRSDDPSDDPGVVIMAPKEVYGIVTTVDEKKVRDITIPLMFNTPVGLSAGFEGHAGTERTEHQGNRMEIHGELYYDDDHDEAPYGVTWDLYENSNQRDGIFRNFGAAIVVSNPPE